MKHSIRILALVLAALMIAALTACTFSVDISKAFSRGTQEGNVYTSTFSGITFTKPSSWTFYTDEQIADVTGTTLEMLKDNEKFTKTAEGELVDFYAVSGNGDAATISFSKGGFLTELQASIDLSIEQIVDAYRTLNFTVDVSEQTDAKLGSVDMQKVTLMLKTTGATLQQYLYFTMVGRYVVCVTCTNASGVTDTQFEQMFS